VWRRPPTCVTGLGGDRPGDCGRAWGHALGLRGKARDHTRIAGPPSRGRIRTPLARDVVAPHHVLFLFPRRWPAAAALCLLLGLVAGCLEQQSPIKAPSLKLKRVK